MTDKIELPFEYTVVPGEAAFETCLNLRKAHKGKATPVIIGTYEDARNLSEMLENIEDSAEDIIKRSLNCNIETLIQNRLNEGYELINEDELGEWPDALPQVASIAADKNIFSGEFLKEVYIALIPTGNSYEVPAYLKFGGWNDCPSPEEQIGILRYWYNKYGAQVISIKSDILECTVDNPPKTKEEALALAKEQFFYCSDIVYQGTDDVATLAGILYNSNCWYFWWD